MRYDSPESNQCPLAEGKEKKRKGKERKEKKRKEKERKEKERKEKIHAGNSKKLNVHLVFDLILLFLLSLRLLIILLLLCWNFVCRVEINNPAVLNRR